MRAILWLCLVVNIVVAADNTRHKRWFLVAFSAFALLMCVSALTSCATIEPNAVSLEAEHVSHISQHFGAHPTNFGYDDLMLAARWRRGRFHWRLADGMVLEAQDPRVNEKCYGGLWGPREVFEASAGYDIWRKK